MKRDNFTARSLSLSPPLSRSDMAATPSLPVSTSSSNKKTTRLYRVWTGNNKFLCGGRLIFGPDARSVLLTSFLIGAPAIAFCLRMFFIIGTYNPSFGYPVLTVGITLTVLAIISLFLTSARDPGVIPRNAAPPEPDRLPHTRTPSVEWINTENLNLNLPRTKTLKLNGHSIKVKFCDTCLLYRPPRASHCSICNNCVQKFDHHCPWVGQCIALRNYPTFICFISLSTMLCIYVFAFSLVNLLHESCSLLTAMRHDVLSVALIVYCFISVWFVGGLTVFHIYLISTNQTTYENFRYRYDKKVNPFNRGFWHNFKEVFCARIPSSMVNFREKVLEEDYCTVMESFNSEHDKDFIRSKMKFDIEMGNDCSKNEGSMKYLQKFEKTDAGDNLKKEKEKNNKKASDDFDSIGMKVNRGEESTRQQHSSSVNRNTAVKRNQIAPFELL